MVFAVNTADILMHLSGDEIARNPDRTDRMSRLSKYIIEQRKYVSEEDASAPFFVVPLIFFSFVCVSQGGSVSSY